MILGYLFGSVGTPCRIAGRPWRGPAAGCGLPCSQRLRGRPEPERTSWYRTHLVSSAAHSRSPTTSPIITFSYLIVITNWFIMITADLKSEVPIIPDKLINILTVPTHQRYPYIWSYSGQLMRFGK